MYRAKIPGLSSLAIGDFPLGNLLFGYGFMAYLAIAVAIVLWYFLTRTRAGLNLRSVGENPATADAAGINVTRYQYLATCIGAGISGLGGLYYTMDYIKGTWGNDGTIESLGWLALALVIFSVWRPLNTIWGSYLFGALTWLYFYIPNLTRKDMELFKMLPYLVTIAVLILISTRKKRENQPPAHLGLSYFREERYAVSPHGKRAPRRLPRRSFCLFQISAWCLRAAARMLRISMARVMGPTPPGTGVMQAALGSTAS